MSKFKEGDRVDGYVLCRTSIRGTVHNPDTPYGLIHVIWDEDGVEDDRVDPYSLRHTTHEEERAADIEEAQRLLAKHGLAFDTAEDNG